MKGSRPRDFQMMTFTAVFKKRSWNQSADWTYDKH